MKLVISDTIDINKKFYKAIYQKLEQQAKQFNACVVPDLLSDGITWDYDYLKIYRNNLSQFLIEIDEADSYKYLLKNPLVGDDFNETQQSQIIDVLKKWRRPCHSQNRNRRRSVNSCTRNIWL